METCCTPEQFALIGITADQIGTAYLWGFSSVIAAWALGWTIGVAVRVIKQL